MAFRLAHPRHLFDRTWRPCHPLRPRLSTARTWGMRISLLFLCTVIIGYVYLTNPSHVQAMASAYLSELLGGDVTIHRARLSIFEGLRLDDVTVNVDPSHGGPGRPDSTLFRARTLLIRYKLSELLAGRLVATQIIAIDPVVMLVEDPVAQSWNYQRLSKTNAPSHWNHPTGPRASPSLPQIDVRDARIEYLTLDKSIMHAGGSFSLDGHLTPADTPGSYTLSLQSRGTTELGPSVEGTIRTDGGQSTAILKNFSFGPDVRSMLPSGISKWFDLHDPKGSIDQAAITYIPGIHPDRQVNLSLDDVEMTVHSQELMSREQLARLSGPLPPPYRLQHVSGDLLFTDEGIELHSVVGEFQYNWLALDGKIAGYDPDAPGQIHIRSIPIVPLKIPALSPAYIRTLPPDVQRLYESLHPQGTCDLDFMLQRRQSGGRVELAGDLNVRDGQFCDSDFPYPVSGATGKIHIGYDAAAGMEGIRILGIQGHGAAHGPNASATVSLEGFVGPLDATAGVWINIHGRNGCTDPTLRAAMPPPARAAFDLFDPDQTGKLPLVRGDFLCKIVCPVGLNQLNSFQTDLDITKGEGALASFPYPLRDISGRIELRDGFLNVVNLHMQHGSASVVINGSVTYAPSPHAGPNLKIVAQNIPIDNDLKKSLNPDQRAFLEKTGLTGQLNVDAQLTPSADPTSADFTASVSIHDAIALPIDGSPYLTGISADLHATPGAIKVDNFIAHHADAVIRGRAAMDPGLSCFANADSVPLDSDLRKLLPASLRDRWDMLAPRGSVDITQFGYQAAHDGQAARFDLELRPRDLSVTPVFLPYRLDNVQGKFHFTDAAAVFDLTAHHTGAQISMSGSADFSSGPHWKFSLQANPVSLAELSADLPGQAATLLTNVQAAGDADLDVKELDIQPNLVQFDGKVTLHDASAQLGLPVEKINGSITLAGQVISGRLDRLDGQCDMDSLQLADRPTTAIKLNLSKPSGNSRVQLSHIEGSVASGDVAGSAAFTFTPQGPSDYDIDLVLRDADLKTLTHSDDKNQDARITASLQMAGTLGQAGSRRGHGDVSVTGKDMYDVPVLLGLVQIANLALPISTPFTDASCRYRIDGEDVTLSRIDLHSPQMSMSGAGDLDFGARKVSLWFTTNNPALLVIPVVGQLLQGANKELLKIHVSGTITNPKVSAATLNTITTTVDQVFKGDH